MKRKKRKTNEQWVSAIYHVGLHVSDGLTIAEACKKEGIAVSNYYAAKKRVKKLSNKGLEKLKVIADVNYAPSTESGYQEKLKSIDSLTDAIPYSTQTHKTKLTSIPFFHSKELRKEAINFDAVMSLIREKLKSDLEFLDGFEKRPNLKSMIQDLM